MSDDRVPITELHEGDWFWDSDGDLSVVVEVPKSPRGTYNCRYSSRYKRRDHQDAVPDPLPEHHTMTAINHTGDTYVRLLRRAVEPVTDDEMAEVMRSILAAVKKN